MTPGANKCEPGAGQPKRVRVKAGLGGGNRGIFRVVGDHYRGPDRIAVMPQLRVGGVA